MYKRLVKRINKVSGKAFAFPIVVIVFSLLIWVGYEATWTGFDKKTLWDWMDLLIIPVVLGIGATLYNRAEQKAERRRELDRQRQETLITYTDQMQDLLLNHKLRDSKENDEVRIVARARTVLALKSLDGPRIVQLLQFLTEADLGGEKLLHIVINKVDFRGTDLTGVDLQGASLNGVNMEGALLGNANLQGADLHISNMKKTFLQKSNLQGANLGWANLQRADLSLADLQGTYLGQANLQGAYLRETILSGVDLGGANLREAFFIRANLQGANFDGANLQEARLIESNLREAFFRKSHLREARIIESDLQGAHLFDANFEKANLTKTKLKPQQLFDVHSLKNAVMPDGTQYEEWVKKGRPDWGEARNVGQENGT